MPKKFVLAMVFAVVFCTMAMAQSLSDVNQVSYFTNRNNPTGFDQIVDITNPGVQGVSLTTTAPSVLGVMCANLYVFAADQQMAECCACPITPDGLLTLSVNKNLTGNTVTSVSPGSGEIELVSSAEIATCDPTAIDYYDNIAPDLRAWATHLDQTTPGTLFTTERPFQDAPLTMDNVKFLSYTCRFIQYLGSGKGVCSCPSTP
jgi:hypothetical protein